MYIRTLIKKREELEKDIQNLIIRFEKDTGYLPEAVSMETVPITPMDGRSHNILSGVRVELKL